MNSLNPSSGTKIWVVIPAYNEGINLEILLDELKKKGLSVFVVDDGSRDNTYSLAKEKADLVIRNQRNRGKGMSLSKGISYLFAHEKFDYIIIMDADGQHSPSDLGKFLKEAKKGEDFVVGNRMENHLGMPFIRVATNRFMSWLISLIARQKIPDTQCGFRLIKREVLENISINTKKFEIESEILIKAARSGFRIKSIPIKSIYSKSLRSKIQPLIDTVRFIKFIFKMENGRL